MSRYNDTNVPNFASGVAVTAAATVAVGAPVLILGGTGISFTMKSAAGTPGTAAYRIFITDFGGDGLPVGGSDVTPVFPTDYVDSGAAAVPVLAATTQRIGLAISGATTGKWAQLVVSGGDGTTALTGIAAAMTVRKHPA